MAEFRGFSEGIRQGDNGILRAGGDAFSTVDAFLFEDYRLAFSDSDRLRGAHAHTFHPALALFQVDADGMEVLIHPILFCLKK
jgi:hypothetical protein